MKKLLLIVGILAMPSFAAVSANVAFASDYVWRGMTQSCLLYTSPSPRDNTLSRMPSSA